MKKMVSDHDLLTRIDERQAGILSKINNLCKSISAVDEKKVDDDKDYQAMVSKVDSLWDIKNRMIGVMLGSGVVGGTLPLLVQNLIKAVSAHF